MIRRWRAPGLTTPHLVGDISPGMTWLLQNSLGQQWLAICAKHGWTPEARASDALDTLEERRKCWRAKRAVREVSPEAMMPIESEEEQRWKDGLGPFRNAFADAYFDMQRCLVKANQQLLKGLPPEKLQKTYDDVGKRCVDLEKQIPAADWQPEVQNRYADFLKEIPQVMAAYKANSGKMFLEKMPLNP